MKNNKKAVVFCSIAAELQGEKALADQENICRDMAKEDGCKVVKVINEVANKIGPMRKGLMILIDFIKKNSDKDWSWYWISRNPGITLQDIEDNLVYPWHWD